MEQKESDEYAQKQWYSKNMNDQSNTLSVNKYIKKNMDNSGYPDYSSGCFFQHIPLSYALGKAI